MPWPPHLGKGSLSHFPQHPWGNLLRVLRVWVGKRSPGLYRPRKLISEYFKRNTYVILIREYLNWRCWRDHLAQISSFLQLRKLRPWEVRGFAQECTASGQSQEEMSDVWRAPFGPFSCLAWRIPWTEESGGLEYMRSRRVRLHWVTVTLTCLRNRNIWSFFFFFQWCYIVKGELSKKGKEKNSLGLTLALGWTSTIIDPSSPMRTLQSRFLPHFVQKETCQRSQG